MIAMATGFPIKTSPRCRADRITPMPVILFVAAFFVLSLCSAAAGATPDPFELSLQEADRIRSAAPERFESSIRALEARHAEASPQQRQRLRYLRVYATVLYGNNLDAGIAAAKELFNEATDFDLRFRTGSLIANLYTVKRDFGEGLRYLDLTLASRDRVRDDDIRHDGMNTAAGLYNELGQYRLALEHATETLADEPGPRAHCVAGFLQLRAQYQLAQLPDDDTSFTGAIDRCMALGEKIPANLVRFVLARKWAATGQRERAIALLQDHLAEVETTGYSRLVGEAHSLLAQFLLAQNDLPGAQRHAQRSIALGSGTATLPLVMAHQVMYEIAQRRNDPISALHHYRNYAEADKAYLDEVKARELVYQTVRQESAKKAQQLRLLGQQNELLQLQQRVQTQANQNMGLMVLLLASLLAGLGLWAVRVKRLHVALRRVAETDALTGISNRHQFTRQAERSLAQCEAAGESVAIIMFDLDRFKAINDAYGHDAGDWVLKQVAEACSGLCRRIDHFGRIGGEEFAILLHGCELKAAVRLAEDCRIRLANIETSDSGHAFAITASFGVSSSRHSGYGLARLMSHADLVLYRAKREGRNRVSAFTGDLPPVSPVATLLPLPVQTATDVDVAVAHSPGAGRPARGGTS